MNRIRYIEHKGKKILFTDFSDLGADQLKIIYDMIDEMIRLIAQCPPKSVLVLGNYNDTHVDKALAEKITEMIKKNRPYIKKSAALGITGIKRKLAEFALSITGRKIKFFDKIEEAKDWLVEGYRTEDRGQKTEASIQNQESIHSFIKKL